jgi:hypothetical protein
MNEPRVETKNPLRCFNLAFLRNVLLATLAVLALAFLSRGFPKGGAIRVALGAGQALLMAGTVLYTVSAIRRLDEFMQRVQLEAIAIAFAISGAVITGYGMLEHAGLPQVEWGIWGWPLMTLLWALALAVRSRHYK